MIICLSGLPGSNTANISKLLALQLGIKYLSKEALLRKIAKSNKKTLQEIEQEVASEEFVEKLRKLLLSEAKNDHVIIDWPLACWAMSEAELRVFLYSAPKQRAEKIIKKEKIPLSDAKRKIDEEEQKLRQNMLKLLGVNIYDVKNFDLAINVDKVGMEGAASIIIRYLKNVKMR
ncbi:MAG: cytidylate kinase family protein [Candidatus Diapherotrites archaeon]|nr:cytidylate kinase family protein [Candidatus Diapherotrites archaeon]